MENKTIYLILFCLVLAGGFAYFYYNYDLKKEVIEFSNLSISAEFNGQKIKTGYIIESEHGKIEGNTSQSYEKAIVTKNQEIKIYNKNIDDQNYYIDSRTFNITKSTQRITLELIEPKEINVKILSKNPILVYLESEDARDIDFCLSWSLNYIFVKTNFTETEKFESWNKCYSGGFSLINSNKTIQIDYSKFGTPGENDYIKLLLITGLNNTKEVKIL